MALVVTRRLGETLLIGKDIKIDVIEIKRGSVRIAVSAPDGVEIHRPEALYYKQMTKSQGKNG